MKFIRKIFNFVIFFQFGLFVIFIIENVDNLDDISMNVAILGDIYEFTFNFYTILAVIAMFMVVIILLSLNIFGLGFNEEGTKTIGKYIAFLGLITILGMGNLYYMLQFGIIGLLFELFIFAIYLLYAVTSIGTQVIAYE